MLDRGHSDLQRELALCGVMLDMDARNCTKLLHTQPLRCYSTSSRWAPVSHHRTSSHAVLSWPPAAVVVAQFSVGTIDALLQLVPTPDLKTSSLSQRQTANRPSHIARRNTAQWDS